MSKYAEKRQHTVECTDRSCEDPATKLLGIQGRPYWLCDQHYEEYREAQP